MTIHSTINSFIPKYYIVYCKDTKGDIWSFHCATSEQIVKIASFNNTALPMFSKKELKQLHNVLNSKSEAFWDEPLMYAETKEAEICLVKKTLKFECIIPTRSKVNFKKVHK
jgi:hypothetical protein